MLVNEEQIPGGLHSTLAHINVHIDASIVLRNLKHFFVFMCKR